MKVIGYIVVVAALVGAGLYFGGYVDGKADVELTEEGRTTYNQGVEKVQEGVGQLKVEAGKGVNAAVDAAVEKMNGLKTNKQ